jgi:hypothetical protein
MSNRVVVFYDIVELFCRQALPIGLDCHCGFEQNFDVFRAFHEGEEVLVLVKVDENGWIVTVWKTSGQIEEPPIREIETLGQFLENVERRDEGALGPGVHAVNDVVKVIVTDANQFRCLSETQTLGVQGLLYQLAQCLHGFTPSICCCDIVTFYVCT